MGILSGEQYDEMLSRMEATASGEELPSVDAQAEEPQQSDDSTDSNPEEDGSSPDAEDVKEEVETKGDDPDPDVPKVPESVPYGRFREVNEKFRSRERDLERAQQRIQDLEQMTLQQAKPQEKSADDWYDNLIESGQPQEGAELSALKAELDSVRSWQQQRTEQLVSNELDAEIAAAVEKYPEVKRQELWQAVAADGTVDVAAVASHIQSGREEMRSRYTSEAQKEVEALKAQLAEAEKAATEARAFRRPGSAAPAPAPHAEGDRPRTVAEATAAFAEAIKERMSL